MIQRKQTLFLLFSIIFLTGYLFSPVIRMEGPGVGYNVTAYELSKNINFPFIGHYFVYVIAIAAGIAIALNLITIFLYKKRKVQYWLCLLAVVPALFCFLYTYYSWATKDSIADSIFYYGNITPWAAIICMIAAAYFVNKDEELLRESARLR